MSGDLQYSLFQGLEFCEEAASRGQPLNDWNATKVASATNVVISNRVCTVILIQMKLVLSRWKQGFKEMWSCKKKCCCGTCEKNTFRQQLSSNYELFVLSKVSFAVRQSLAFCNAHRQAQKEFVEEFTSCPLKPADEQVIEESNAQIMLAEADLKGIDTDDVNLIKGHLVCRILLNNAIKYVVSLSRQRLIPEKDANEMVELLTGYSERILLCRRLYHEGILELVEQSRNLSRLPPHRIEELNLAPIIEAMARDAASVLDVPEAVIEDSEITDISYLDDTNESEENSLFSSLRRVSLLDAEAQTSTH